MNIAINDINETWTSTMTPQKYNTVLLGFKTLGVPEEKVLLMLLLYRFAYYFVPVIIALILSSFEFGTSAKKYILFLQVHLAF
jgi:hypothetical protein